MNISFNLKLPPDIKPTPKELQAWLEYKLNIVCSLHGSNPLAWQELEAVPGSIGVSYGD